MRTYEITVNGKKYSVDVKAFTGRIAEVEVNGEKYSLELNNIGGSKPDVSKASRPEGERALETVAAPSMPASSGSPGQVRAPIPGSVMQLYVKVGDKVQAGSKLLKMEAMKMENELSAPTAGMVKEIHVEEGGSVNQGDILITLDC